MRLSLRQDSDLREDVAEGREPEVYEGAAELALGAVGLDRVADLGEPVILAGRVPASETARGPVPPSRFER